MKVLVACEFSGTVRRAFAALGQAQAIEQALDDLQAAEDDADERRAEQRAEDRRDAR